MLKKRDLKMESKIMDKNPKEEEKKGELILTLQITVIVHYNPEVNDNFICSQYEFLSDSKSKKSDGFAVINLYARPSGFSKNIDVQQVCYSTNQCFLHKKSEVDIKTLVMDIKIRSKTICEFHIDEYYLDVVYTSNTFPYQNFASAVYRDRHLYISGCTNENFHGEKSKVTEFTFKVKETTGKLMATSKTFQSMQVCRMQHSMMIVRDHLFAFFGYDDKTLFSETIEFLNLQSE